MEIKKKRKRKKGKKRRKKSTGLYKDQKSNVFLTGAELGQ
jgi:hypothetical protein